MCINKNMILIFAVVFLSQSFRTTSAIRNITISHNPGCSSASCSNRNLSVNLIYARSQGSDDCLHYIFSTVGPSWPTLMLLRSTKVDSKLSITWEKLLMSPLNVSAIEGAVKIVDSDDNLETIVPEGAIFVLSKLLEYKDASDSANIYDPNNKNISQIPLDDMTWNVTTANHHVYFQGTSQKQPQHFSNYSCVEIKFNLYDSDGRDTALPRMAYNDLTTKLEFIVNNLTVNSSNSRFSLEVLTSNPRNSSFESKFIGNGMVEKTSSTSIDDEYAPSVFTSEQFIWKLTGNSNKDMTNFWHWRAVCYTKEPHKRKYSTDVKSSSLLPANKSAIDSTLKRNRLLLSYFGGGILTNMSFSKSLISFGKPDDDFYSDTNYISWTTIIGFGSPPSDSFSLLVICILFVAIGCPLVVIIAGAVYLIVGKLRGQSVKRSKYQPIG